MSAFVVEPVFTQLQLLAFAGLLAFGLAIEFAFSPRRSERLGAGGFLLGAGLMQAPAVAGVTLVRGAYRLGYLEDGRGFLEANLRSIPWMIGAIVLGRLAVRRLPPFSFATGALIRADRAIWSERLGRWFGGRR
jgi:hypothetical protein